MEERTMYECGKDMVDMITKNEEIMRDISDEVESMKEKIINFQKNLEARALLRENLIGLAIRNGFVRQNKQGELFVSDFLSNPPTVEEEQIDIINHPEEPSSNCGCGKNNCCSIGDEEC